MTKDFAHYRQLERRLWMARWMHQGEESLEEDAILEDMEDTWLHLTYDEQDLLRREPPRCWPTEPCSIPPQAAEGSHPSVPIRWIYEGFKSPLEAILGTEAA